MAVMMIASIGATVLHGDIIIAGALCEVLSGNVCGTHLLSLPDLPLSRSE